MQSLLSRDLSNKIRQDLLQVDWTESGRVDRLIKIMCNIRKPNKTRHDPLYTAGLTEARFPVLLYTMKHCTCKLSQQNCRRKCE